MDEFANKASSLCLNHPLEPDVFLPCTTKYLVNSYRNFKILSAPCGKRFVWHHLVELIAARVLVMKGWGREKIAQRLHDFSPEFLIDNLPDLGSLLDLSRPAVVSGQSVTPIQTERALMACRLLAAGVCEQYKIARNGTPIVHDATMSESLAQALLLFSSLYICAGQEDLGGSVHDVLQRCCKPLGCAEWQLPVLTNANFLYHGITLLDPDRRIPTLDCVEMARQTQSELDLQEQLAFEALRSVSEQFVGREASAYSQLRLWVTEHPITTAQEMRQFERSGNLQLAVNFLSGCYEAVQPHHLVDQKLYLCDCCGNPMRRFDGDGRLLACRVVQCSSFDKPLEMLPTPFSADTLVARLAILTYWIGPGLDELALYRKAQAGGYDVTMYPAKDVCDLGLDGRDIGIDVKSYASPFVLAERLNRSCQGLTVFRRRIIAVNDQAISRFHGYLDILRRNYAGDLSLEFMSVADIGKLLEPPF